MDSLRALPLLASAGFASMMSMRLCDAMLPALAQTFETQPAEAAQVISAFAVAYGLLQLAYGPLGDRFGKALVISLATFACSMGALAAALSPTLDVLTLSRVLMGAGAAGIIPLTMAWIGDRVPYSQRQEVLARLLGSTVLGMMAGSWAGGLLADTVGWRSAFFGIAALFLVVGLALWCRHPREEHRTAASPQRSYLHQLAAVFVSSWARQVFALSFVEGALVFGALAFVPSHLHERFQMSLSEAGAVVALFGLGGLLYSRVAGRLLAPTRSSCPRRCRSHQPGHRIRGVGHDVSLGLELAGVSRRRIRLLHAAQHPADLRDPVVHQCARHGSLDVRVRAVPWPIGRRRSRGVVRQPVVGSSVVRHRSARRAGVGSIFRIATAHATESERGCGMTWQEARTGAY